MLCNVVHCNCRNFMGYCKFTACLYPEIKNHYDRHVYNNSTSDTRNTLKPELLYNNQTIITNKGKY